MKQIFEKLITDLVAQKVITEDAKAKLVTELEAAITAHDTKIYEKAVEAVDEDHSKKLEEVISSLKETHKKEMESMDNDHAEKLDTIVKKIDEKYTKKLTEAIDVLKKKSVDGKLVNMVSDYFDAYLKESAPEQAIVDAEELKRLKANEERMRQILFISDKYIQTEVKEAIQDGYNQLQDKDKTINALMLEKVELVKKLNKNERDETLKEKTKDMPPRMKAYVETFFKEASKEEIEGKLNEAVKAFELEESKVREKIVAEADTKKKVTSPVVSEEKVPDVTNESGDPLVEHAANVLTKSFASRAWRN